MEVEIVEVGCQNWVRTEKVAPVSMRKEICLPAIITVTLGSHRVMAIVGWWESGLLQFSVASPKRPNQGVGGVDGLLTQRARGQSPAQWSFW